MVRRALGYQLYACGPKGPPAQITVGRHSYSLLEILKHDFFAATALYKKDNCQTQDLGIVVLKINRQHHLLGMPLAWLGQLICKHETSILKHLSNIGRVPEVLSRHGKTGFVYEYLPGKPLNKAESLPCDFFDELIGLTKQIHNYKIAYMDMNKKNNIIVGLDRKPYLIDFQISLYIANHRFVPRRLDMVCALDELKILLS